MTFTELDVQSAIDALNDTLKDIFAARSIEQLTEVSQAVQKTIGGGEYPVINMWMLLQVSKHPDGILILGMCIMTMVRLLQGKHGPKNSGTLKQ